MLRKAKWDVEQERNGLNACVRFRWMVLILMERWAKTSNAIAQPHLIQIEELYSLICSPWERLWSPKDTRTTDAHNFSLILKNLGWWGSVRLTSSNLSVCLCVRVSVYWSSFSETGWARESCFRSASVIFCIFFFYTMLHLVLAQKPIETEITLLHIPVYLPWGWDIEAPRESLRSHCAHEHTK